MAENHEKGIIRKFQDLRVFRVVNLYKSPYSMDDLVHDFTNALEETSKPQSKSDDGGCKILSQKSTRRRRGKKRRPGSMIVSRHGNILGSQSGPVTISEASESSLDEALKDYFENVLHHSDSDDIIKQSTRMPPLAIPHSLLSLPESDSYPENSQMRPPRRRRKFNKMAVEEPLTIDTTMVEDKPRKKRLKARNMQAPLEGAACINDSGSDNNSGTPINISPLIATNSRLSPSGTKRRLDSQQSKDNTDDGMDTAPEEASSSISSSEDDGFVTYDEGREGDDEQSDFFHETGPSSGIPGIVPWWETGAGNNLDQDQNFEKILCGSFEYLSTSAQRTFQSRLRNLNASKGREIRKGRRRLREKQHRCVGNASHIQMDKALWVESQYKGLIHIPTSANQSKGSNQGTVKRRKTTTAGLVDDMCVDSSHVAEGAAAIPSTNKGNQMLQNMGWTPGTGLGPGQDGIQLPINVSIRPRRQGLAAKHESS